MNIVEILTDLGIEEDAAKKAERAINKEIPQEFVKKDQYNKKVLELDETKKDLKAAQTSVTDAEAYKSKYEQEVEAHNQTKETASTATADWEKKWADRDDADAARDLTAKKQGAIKAHLEKDGANPKLVNLLLKEFDLETVELDGDSVKDWETVGGSVKENYADVFGTVTTKGADVADPPANVGGEVNPWKKGDNFSLAKQTEIYREDPAKARRLAADAGVKL